MKPVAFDYCRPDTVEEALSVLAERGPDATVLAGGMSLGPMLNMRLVRPAVVVDIHRLEALRKIEVNGTPRVGAAARQVDVMSNEAAISAAPLLRHALPHVGHYQTRNRGTFGGSVAHADPSAEIPLCLLTLGGAIDLRSARKQRLIAAEDFFVGVLSTARQTDEMIVGLSFPKAASHSGFAFDEISQRHGDFAIASAAASVTLSEDGLVERLRLGFGGIDDRPVLADTTQWMGAGLSPRLASDIAETCAASLAPLADANASADYRHALAATLAERVLRTAIEEAAA